MFRDYCFLFRKLPIGAPEARTEIAAGDSSDEVGGQVGKLRKLLDPIKDEFRIYKTKELRIDEILAIAKRFEKEECLFHFDPDADSLDFNIETALKIHKRVNLFQQVRSVM